MLPLVYYLTFLLGVSTVWATDIPLNITAVNGLQATVSPDRASISVYRQLAATNFTGKVYFNLKSLRELDANMAEIPNTRFSAFSNPNPPTSLPQPYDTDVPSSNPNVQANCQNVMYIAQSPTSFSVYACAMKSNTTVTYGSETNQLFTGQLGISLAITSWPWKSNGMYLELNMTVAVPNGRTITLKGFGTTLANKIGLGNTDEYALLSTRGVDGNGTGYPLKLENLQLVGIGPSSNMATVFLRIPRSDWDTIYWYSVIEPGYISGSAADDVNPTDIPPGSVSSSTAKSAADNVNPSRMMTIQAVAVLLAVLLAEKL